MKSSFPLCRFKMDAVRLLETLKYGLSELETISTFSRLFWAHLFKVFTVLPNGNMANLLQFYCKTWLFSKVQNCNFFWCVLILECCRTLTFHRANEFELERVMIRFPGLKMNSLKGKWKKKSNYFSQSKRSTHTAYCISSFTEVVLRVNIYGQIPEIVVNL